MQLQKIGQIKRDHSEFSHVSWRRSCTLALRPSPCLPVRWLVSAHLDVWPLVSVGEARLRHLQRPLLLPVRLLQLRDCRLRVRDLVHRLGSRGERLVLKPSSPYRICINDSKVSHKVDLQPPCCIISRTPNLVSTMNLQRTWIEGTVKRSLNTCIPSRYRIIFNIPGKRDLANVPVL